MTQLETAEEFHARVAAATDDEGRLPVAIEAMPGWDIFPFELDGLRVRVTAAIEELPSVGRCHVGRYGDGGAHAHPFFFGRPARMLHLRGSCLLDWEENLPPVPEDVRLANAGPVGRRLVERVGGERPAWEA
jgi:hypothetical protein